MNSFLRPPLHIQERSIKLHVDGEVIESVVVSPTGGMPGVLMVHGWDSDQGHYHPRAEKLSSLGCTVMTFDLRGHGQRFSEHQTVTREDNLHDVLAAYDCLASTPGVDPGSIAVIGTSYGGYLATLLTAHRDLRWLALRAPASYPDSDWEVPKASVNREMLAAFRRARQAPRSNRALDAAAAFGGAVLLVESGNDSVVAHPAIADYLSGFSEAHSLTFRRIEGADHALSEERHRHLYDGLLDAWLKEVLSTPRTAR